MNNLKWLWPIILLLNLFVSQSSWAEENCSPTAPKGCAKLNKELNEFIKTVNTRNATSQRSIPSNIRSGWDKLKEFGIPYWEKVYNQADVSSRSHVRHGIMQEYLRGRNNGLPWLPQSWAITVKYQYYHWSNGVNALEKSLKSVFTYPLNSNDRLLAYLFVGNTPHVNNFNYLSIYRQLAIDIVPLDNSFQDIRDDVHQEPSFRTIARLKAYISKMEKSNHRNKEAILEKANKIVDYILVTYGGGPLKEFLGLYQPELKIIKNLKENVSLLSKMSTLSTLSGFEQQLPASLKVLDKLSLNIKELSTKIDPTVESCSHDKKVNCLFEKFDLMKHMQLAIFNHVNEFLSKADQLGLDISIYNSFSLLKSMVRATIGISLLETESIHELNMVLAKDKATKGDLLGVLSDIEQSLLQSQQKLMTIFSTEIGIYKNFVPDSHLIVDNILRSSSILPMSNLISRMYESLGDSSANDLIIGKNKITSRFRVLNPGIAKGKLYITDVDKISNPEYSYDPEGIYFLPKTPASLQKVAGVITADSGSMISHVQLLAANHGLPNVKVAPSTVHELKALEGKEVYIIALLNGDVKIIEAKAASRKEKRVYRKYNKIGNKKKITLNIPKEIIQYNYPLKLEQLRRSHSGIIAGGKATGQGELAHVFPNKVPAGFVLPFGVYYEHMKKHNLFSFIKELLEKKNGVKMDYKERERRLNLIHAKILNMQIHPEIVEWIRDIITTSPYINLATKKTRGVFVRSDTNAEDREEFVGAGLNKTVANVKGLSNILDAIKLVWASPFRTKAYTWRDDLISNPWDILPSVIIQLGFPSEKAGVMVVGDTSSDDKDDQILIAANQGLGLVVVDGTYSPEEISYSRKTKKSKKVSRAFAPKKYILSKKGWAPNIILDDKTGEILKMKTARKGVISKDIAYLKNILTKKNIKDLAKVADKIQKHMIQEYGDHRKWDMEWGISKTPAGEDYLVLFQIRPFIGNKIVKNISELRKLETVKKGVDNNTIIVNLKSSTTR